MTTYEYKTDGCLPGCNGNDYVGVGDTLVFTLEPQPAFPDYPAELEVTVLAVEKADDGEIRRIYTIEYDESLVGGLILDFCSFDGLPTCKECATVCELESRVEALEAKEDENTTYEFTQDGDDLVVTGSDGTPTTLANVFKDTDTVDISQFSAETVDGVTTITHTTSAGSSSVAIPLGVSEITTSSLPDGSTAINYVDGAGNDVLAGVIPDNYGSITEVTNPDGSVTSTFDNGVDPPHSWTTYNGGNLTASTTTGGVQVDHASSDNTTASLKILGENSEEQDFAKTNFVDVTLNGADIEINTRNNNRRTAWVSKKGKDVRVNEDGTPISPYDMLHPFATPKAAEIALAADPDFDQEYDSIYITPGSYYATEIGNSVTRWVLDNADLTSTGDIFKQITPTTLIIEGIGKSSIRSSGGYGVRATSTTDATSDGRVIKLTNLVIDGRGSDGSGKFSARLGAGADLNKDVELTNVEFIYPVFTSCISESWSARDCVINGIRFNNMLMTDEAPDTLTGRPKFWNCEIKTHPENQNTNGTTSSAILIGANSFVWAGNNFNKQDVKIKLIGCDVLGIDNGLASQGIFDFSVEDAGGDSSIVLSGTQIIRRDANVKFAVNSATNASIVSLEFDETTPINFDPVAESTATWNHKAGSFTVDPNRDY